ncbi:amino acid ABC transporter permease [Halobium salinum]|uniref:Amino acid ABC transporter permease n=1 Tax=Halobium salinum TaxID=1364940 RepID=A0ABD5PAJ5_9EURY|nr:amino acid ABC transporter permease [Halobium salinum]
MAETYSDGTTTDGTGEGFLNDRTLKWVGVAGSALFTLVIAAFLAYIVVVQVNFALLVEVFQPQFVDALYTVLTVVVVGSVLSVTAGVIVGLARVSKTTFTRSVAKGYIEFFRGTPLLFQLAVVFFGIPALWPSGQFPFQNFAYPAAIIGLTLNHAAYIGEAIRGGIESVPDGQMEAARSLGMSYIQSMREVVLPQAWRNALAAIGNDQVILVKDTSLLTFIAVPELISFFRNVNSTNFDAWTPLLLVAIGYLAITVPMGMLVRYLEARADPAGRGDR